MGKLLRSTLLWCCLFFNFSQCVIFMLIFYLALSTLKGLKINNIIGSVDGFKICSRKFSWNKCWIFHVNFSICSKVPDFLLVSGFQFK